MASLSQRLPVKRRRRLAVRPMTPLGMWALILAAALKVAPLLEEST